MRRNRILKNGATYYITGNINRDRMELKENNIKEMLLNVIKQAKQKFNFRMKHFVFIDNHIHFIIKPLKINSLSKIMQWIFGVFAIRYNRKMKIRGKVWFDRFKSQIIKSIKEFENRFFSMNDNPKRYRIVKDNSDYRYSGIFYFKIKDFSLIEPLPCFFEYLITWRMVNYYYGIIINMVTYILKFDYYFWLF